MVDFISERKIDNPWDFVSIEKCVPPVTGHYQKYRMKAGSYADGKVIEFVLDEDELASLKRQIEEVLG